MVAGDFNGTAWRYRGKDNFITIDEAFMDRILLTPPGPPLHCGDLDPFRTIGPTSADFSIHLALNAFGKCISMAHFSFHGNRLVNVPPIKAAIKETWHHLDFVDWSNTCSRQKVHEQRISLKERPAACAYGKPRGSISEIMSDHSLSSLMCDHSHMVFSHCHIATIRSLGSTLSSSPSDFLTHLSLRG